LALVKIWGRVDSGFHMFEKEAGWFGRSILGAAGVGTLLGLTYLFQPSVARIGIAMIFAFAAFSVSAFAMFILFPTAVRIGFFPILAAAGGLGGLVFSLAYDTPLPWSIGMGCVIGLAVPLVFLITSKISHSAGTGESE